MGILLIQLFDVLENIIRQVIDNKGLVITNNLLLKFDSKQCCCLLAIDVIFSDPIFRDKFLSTSESKLNVSAGKKRKKKLVEVFADHNLLLCDLITTILKRNSSLVDMPCIKFYFDKTIAVLTAQDIYFSSLSSMFAHLLWNKLNPQLIVSGVCI